MPPKRKAPSISTAPATKASQPRASKLAKENNISAQEETEVREAWSLFCIDGTSSDEDGEDESGGAKRKSRAKGKGKGKGKVKEDESVMRIEDVKRALIALNIPPTPTELPTYLEILDPDSSGYTSYPHFLAICALKFRSQEHSSDTHQQEVDEAWELFMSAGGRGGRGQGEGKITLASLKRVAQALRDNVKEERLKDMLLEANGGSGVASGVTKEEFERVMRRAGVWR